MMEIRPIQSDSDYAAALNEIDVLMDAETGSAEGNRLDVLANPLQVFRTASMMLFDPQLVMLGPAAYVILDNFGSGGYMLFALVYPIVVGTATAWIGYRLFRRGDLI